MLSIPAPRPSGETPAGCEVPAGGPDAARRGGQEAQPSMRRHLVQIPVAAAARVGSPGAMRRCVACAVHAEIRPDAVLL